MRALFVIFCLGLSSFCAYAGAGEFVDNIKAFYDQLPVSETYLNSTPVSDSSTYEVNFSKVYGKIQCRRRVLYDGTTGLPDSGSTPSISCRVQTVGSPANICQLNPKLC